MKWPLLATIATALCSSAAADPLRLRADALATAASPAGLLVLESEAVATSQLRAEAVVWMADEESDVLVIAVDARDTKRRVQARLGRFVSSLGALRVTHLDGGQLRLSLPQRFQVEAIGGVPVVTGLGDSRSFDWLAGGRISRKLGFGGSVGIAYAHRRDAGIPTSEEVGLDAGYAFGKRSDVGARFAYDLVRGGISEVALTSTLRDESTRTELYAIHRVAARLLPATSLFTVLGNVPAQRVGTLLTWKAAPRLDLILDLGVRRIADSDLEINDVGAEFATRARLRLDPRGASMLGAELRRYGVGDGAWSGARGTARIELRKGFALATELELVRPDDDSQGSIWPWALVAASWQRGPWSAAIATEASTSAQYRYRFDVLAQLARTWGRP